MAVGCVEIEFGSDRLVGDESLDDGGLRAQHGADAEDVGLGGPLAEGEDEPLAGLVGVELQDAAGTHAQCRIARTRRRRPARRLHDR